MFISRPCPYTGLEGWPVLTALGSSWQPSPICCVLGCSASPRLYPDAFPLLLTSALVKAHTLIDLFLLGYQLPYLHNNRFFSPHPSVSHRCLWGRCCPGQMEGGTGCPSQKDPPEFRESPWPSVRRMTEGTFLPRISSFPFSQLAGPLCCVLWDQQVSGLR